MPGARIDTTYCGASPRFHQPSPTVAKLFLGSHTQTTLRIAPTSRASAWAKAPSPKTAKSGRLPTRCTGSRSNLLDLWAEFADYSDHVKFIDANGLVSPILGEESKPMIRSGIRWALLVLTGLIAISILTSRASVCAHRRQPLTIGDKRFRLFARLRESGRRRVPFSPIGSQGE